MSRLMGIAAALAVSLGIASGLAACTSEASQTMPGTTAAQSPMIGADRPVHLGRVVVIATPLPDIPDWI